MLPSLSGLRIYNVEDVSAGKRSFDPLLSFIRQKALRTGIRSKEYETLILEIIKAIPSGNIKDIAMKALKERLKESQTAAFVPSYESQHAAIPAKGIGEDVAKQIAGSFFESMTDAPYSQYYELSLKELVKEQTIVELYKDLEKTRELTFGEKRKLNHAQFSLKQRKSSLTIERGRDVGKHLWDNNKKLIKTLVNDAVNSFLSLDSSDLQPLLRVNVTLALQDVDYETYDPFVDHPHMDLEMDMIHPNGQRYGRPASEQDVSSLVASFCADKGEEDIILSGCGTVVYDGVPVIDPDLIAEVARDVQNQPEMGVYTEYEIISQLGREITKATESVLRKRTDDDLRSMGIVSTSQDMLKWTNANALSFHRSALRDEVLKGGSLLIDGTNAPRMRAFAIILTDQQVKEPDDATYNLPPITTRSGRKIEVGATIVVRLGGPGAIMGEELMP